VLRVCCKVKMIQFAFKDIEVINDDWFRVNSFTNVSKRFWMTRDN
jgi:hypothetical protein